MPPDNLSESAVRSLSNSVSSLATSIKSISGKAARSASRPLANTGKVIGEQYNINKSSTAGVAVASAINPFAGELVRQIVAKNEGSVISSIKGTFSSSAKMLDAIKNKLVSDKQEVRKADPNPIRRVNGKRLSNTSFTNLYGSENEVEALDRLRISNAEWLKSVATLTPDQLKSKRLPKADVGGLVTKTGKAVVHKGEVIVTPQILKQQLNYLGSIARDIRAMRTSSVGRLSGDKRQDISVFSTSLAGDPFAASTQKSFAAKQIVLLERIADSLGQTSSSITRTVDITISRSLGKNPALLGLYNLSKGIYSTFAGIAKIKLLDGPSQAYARLVIKRTPMETIAAATSATYGQMRHDMEIVQDQLSSLIAVTKGKQIDLPNRTTDEFGWNEGLKRFLITGDLTEFFGPISKTDQFKKVSGVASSGLNKITNFATSGFGKISERFKRDVPKAALGADIKKDGLIMAHAGETITPAKDVKTQRDSLTSIDRTLKYMSDIQYETYKRENIDKRYENIYRSKSLEWYRKNKFNEVVTRIWTLFNPVIKTTGNILSTSVLALSNLLGFKLGGAGGSLKMAATGGGAAGLAAAGMGAASRGGSGFLTGFQRARTSGGGLLSSLSRGGRGAYMGATKGGVAVGKGLKFAGLAAGLTAGTGALVGGAAVTSAVAKAAAAAGSVAAPVLLPISIILSAIDGIRGWFSAGKIFEVAQKDATFKMKVSSLVAGILDGLWGLIRYPFNLVAKLAGSELRLNSILEPVAKAFHKFIIAVDPLLVMITEASKLIWSFTKNTLKTFVNSIAAITYLFIEPSKSLEFLKDSVVGWLKFMAIELPKGLFNITTSFLKGLAKAVFATFVTIPVELAKWSVRIAGGIAKLLILELPKFLLDLSISSLIAIKDWMINSSSSILQSSGTISKWSEQFLSGVNEFVKSIFQNLNTWIEKIDAFPNIVDNIVSNILPNFIERTVNNLFTMLDNLISGKTDTSFISKMFINLSKALGIIAIKVPWELAKGLTKAFFKLATTLPVLLGKVIYKGWVLLNVKIPFLIGKALGKAFSFMWTKIPEMLADSVKAAIKFLPTKLTSIGSRLVDSLTTAVSYIIDTVIGYVIETATILPKWIKKQMTKMPLIGSYFKDGANKGNKFKFSSTASERKKLEKQIPGAATGALVTKSGLAIIHKDEVVVPAAKLERNAPEIGKVAKMLAQNDVYQTRALVNSQKRLGNDLNKNSKDNTQQIVSAQNLTTNIITSNNSSQSNINNSGNENNRFFMDMTDILVGGAV